MLIHKDDNSQIEYYKDMIRPLRKQNGLQVWCRINCRRRLMYLHGGAKLPGGEIVNITIDDYKAFVYTLVLKEKFNDEVLFETEVVVGTSYSKALRAWELIRKYKTLPFKDIEAVLEENGFPEPMEFDRLIKDHVILRIRQMRKIQNKPVLGFIERENVNLKMVDITDTAGNAATAKEEN